MHWILRNTSTKKPPPEISDWAESLDISSFLANFLWLRSLTNAKAMHLFLSPRLSQLAPLEDWPGLIEAASIIVAAIKSKHKICIWGDYDVDGITATALLMDFFNSHEVPCQYHIPNRLVEGYGINATSLDKLVANGVQLLITVDSGISDVDAIKHAKKIGLTVVITDHHIPPETLPPADAIVNPRLTACPCPSLAGVGVAFFLAAAINSILHANGQDKMDIRQLLDLVALGTLADIVDLAGQNRILVKNGLLTVKDAVRPGIVALKSICNFAPTAALGAGQILFSLAPRINAAGRLGYSDTAVELLLTKDKMKAAELANTLAQFNAKRRAEEDAIFDEALSQAQREATKGMTGIVLYADHWHQGVIGIVASRIVEQLNLPTVILSKTEKFFKGSGRSVNGFDIHDAFVQCQSFLLGFGGHAMAAGLSLSEENLPVFQNRFNELAKAQLGANPPQRICKIDGLMSFATAADFTILKELELLQPFGTGNTEPTFVSPPVHVKTMRKHPGGITLVLEDPVSKICLPAKAWREVANIPLSIKGSLIRIAFTPRIDRYNGIASVELRLKDWKPATEDISWFDDACPL